MACASSLLFISERPLGVVVWGNDDTSERYRRQTVRLAEELAKCGLASLLFTKDVGNEFPEEEATCQSSVGAPSAWQPTTK